MVFFSRVKADELNYLNFKMNGVFDFLNYFPNPPPKVEEPAWALAADPENPPKGPPKPPPNDWDDAAAVKEIKELD